MLYLLERDVRTVKWNGIPLHEASSAIVKEETNGDFTLTVRYPITDTGIYQLIKEDMLIKAPTPVLGHQLFRIKKPVENDDSLDITAYHVSEDIMKRSIRPVSVVGQSCAMALSQMVQNAKTGLGDFSFTSDIMDSRTFNTEEAETLYTVLMDGKHSIVGTWEGELVRDNFALSIKRSRGSDRGVVITTHKNLKSYQRTKNSQGVVTRIHARSTFKPEGAKDEVTLRVTVDSPLINSYPYINEKDYENNNAKTTEELRKWAEAKFTNDGIDKVSDAIEIEAYELNGQVVHLGDTVNIKSRKHNVDIYKKAIAYEFNCLANDGNGEYISITFDDKPGVGGSGVSSGLGNAANAILGVNTSAQEIAIAKAVKNANQAFDAEFEKRQVAIDDAIEQAKADAEEYADTVRQEIDAKVTEVDTKATANELLINQRTAEVLAKAGVAESLAQEAKNIGNQAKTDAVNAINGALEAKQLAQAAGGQISQVQLAVDEANRQILQRVTKAEINPITQRLSSAEATILTQAGQIEQRLTSTQVESAITGKGYITSSALQPYALATTVQNLVQETADSFSRTISETKALIPSDAVNRNLLDTNNAVSSTILFGEETYPNTSINNGYPNNSTIKTAILVDAGAKYTFSKNTKSGKDNYWRVSYLDSNFAYVGRFAREGNVFTITIPANVKYLWVSYPDDARCKIEKGDKATPYALSVNDTATVTALHAVNDTVDSHTRTIGAVGTSGSILDNISQVTQTAAGLVSRVSLITDAQNLVYDPTRYSKYVARNSTSNLQKANYSQYSAMRINHSGLTADTYSGFKMPLRTSTFTAGEKLSLMAVIGIDVLPDSGGHIKFEIKNQGTIIAYFWLQPTRTGNNQVFTAATTVNVSTATVDEYGLDILINRNGNVNITQISIVRGGQVPTSFVDSTTSQDLAISTQVSQLAGSYAIQNLNSAGDLINGINLGADGVNRISGKLTRITGETIIDNAVIKSAMVDKLKTANFEAGSVTATIIGAEAVTADKIKVDQALFNKLMADEAYLRQLFAKNAFITSVQAVTLSASKITSGILESINNATNFNLQTGWIDMNAEAVGIRNLWPNHPIQYLIFGRGAINGKSGSYTALMSNSKRAIGMNDGSAGIQIWNSMDNTTAINLYGDEIAMMYNANDSKGLIFNNVNNTIGNVDNIYLSSYGNYNLVSLFNNIYDNLKLLHNNKTTETNYSYTLFGPR